MELDRNPGGGAGKEFHHADALTDLLGKWVDQVLDVVAQCNIVCEYFQERTLYQYFFHYSLKTLLYVELLELITCIPVLSLITYLRLSWIESPLYCLYFMESIGGHAGQLRATGKLGLHGRA